MRGSKPALLTFSMSCDLMYSVLWVLQFITTFNFSVLETPGTLIRGARMGERPAA